MSERTSVRSRPSQLLPQGAIPRAGAPQGSPQWISWREAVTPVSRGSRRRWVAFFVAMLLGVAAAAWWTDGDTVIFPWMGVVTLFVASGLLRRSTRGLTGGGDLPLDERDEATRNRAYRVAFPLFGLVLLATGVGFAAAVPDPVGSAADLRAGLFFAGLWLVAWLSFLPMAVVAWTEPDDVPMEGDPAEAAGLPEAARDGVVMLGLTAAAAVEAFAHGGGWGLFIVVATLSVVAGLKRWAVGQVPVSTGLQGVGIFLAILGVAFTVIAATGNGDTLSFAIMTVVGVALIVLGTIRRD